MTRTTTKPRRMAREPQGNLAAGAINLAKQPSKLDQVEALLLAPAGAINLAKQPSKLDQVEALLLAPTGATIAEIMTATGWQQHSVRGALAGALKKRGLIITSDKIDDLRRYRASKPA